MIGHVDDWERFLAEVTWFVRPGEAAVVGASRSWSREPAEGLPELSGLLAEATVTPVVLDGREYELMAWGSRDHRRGWLSLPPESELSEGLAAAHRNFLAACGGIVERFNEPATWWNNQNEVLTASAAQDPLAPILEAYAWIWQDDGLTMPINPDDFYVAAVEANGNLTLVDAHSGKLLLFAPDHAFDGVTPLPGCPPYSLMTIDGVPDVGTWIESCAAAWRVG